MKTTLFKNATIFPTAYSKSQQWLLVQNGRIVALGHEKEPPPLMSIDETVDLQQGFVLPAFGDAHLHLLWSAQQLLEVDLSPAQSLQQALSILKKEKARFKKGQWVVGRGFNKNNWSDGQPNIQALDALFPANPVYLESQDCHAAWVNRLALKICGVTSATPDPPGGKFLRSASGDFTGLVLDRAMEVFKKQLPVPQEAQLLDALDRLVQKLLQAGITQVHAMEALATFELWQKYQQRYGKKIRVVFYFFQEFLEELLKQKFYTGLGDAWLNIGGVKFFADGSLGAQTAALRQPYSGQNDNRGLLMFTDRELQQRVHLAESNRLATAIHAIGDLAVEQVLHILKMSEGFRQLFGLVSRIEHAQLVPPDLLRLFKQQGLVASVQPIHIADDVKIAERYWEGRTRFAYPLRSLRRQVPLAFGSDAPVAAPDPLRGIFSAVARKFQCNPKETVWIPEERITVRQAVQAFTSNVAFAGGLAKSLGALRPGLLADFVVLNKNIFHVKPEALLQVKVVQTVVQGKTLFKA